MDVKIDNNLDCFDTEKAWSKIEKQLEDKTDIRRHNYKKISTFSIAVISAVAAVVAIVIMVFKPSDNGTQTLYANNGTSAKELMLPDSSEINLYSNSKLAYNDGKDRNVKLEGSAFFKVKKDGRRFIIEAGDAKVGIDTETMNHICDAIKKVHDMGVKISIVVGGGNFWRGKYGEGMVKTTADYMGMLATVMNGLALQDAIEKRGIEARLQTAIEMRQIAEPFIQRRAERHLEKNRIVIFACGTGHPFFSTDTTAALRAAEMGVDAILVAKTIDGVYTADPIIDKQAKKLDHVTYQEILEKDLKVMDSTAISLCKDNHIPLVVFAMSDAENIIRAVKGENIGTFVD